MIEVGQINELEVEDEDSKGYFVRAEDNEERAFMPRAFAPRDLSLGDKIKVFIYLDTEACLLATSHFPSAVLGEYALMRVVETTHFGAFVNWGISKDLLIPDTEQKEPMRMGESYIVRV